MKSRLITATLAITMIWSTVHASEGVASWKEIGRTRLDACFNAKRFADNRVPRGSHVTGHSECDCEQNSLTQLWTCSVDANWKSNEQ
jgi:hypothetical protein